MKKSGDNRNYSQKQAYADVERERYLAKLKAKTERRDNTRALRDMAHATGEEHARQASQRHLGSMSHRSEFRAKVHDTWLSGHIDHQELHRKLGQLHRERLIWLVGRSLEDAATLRIEFEQKRLNRSIFAQTAQEDLAEPDLVPSGVEPAQRAKLEAAQTPHTPGNTLKHE